MARIFKNSIGDLHAVCDRGITLKQPDWFMGCQSSVNCKISKVVT